VITRPAYNAANKKIIAMTQQRAAAILQAIGWGTDDDVDHGAGMVADVLAAAQVAIGHWVNAHLGNTIGLHSSTFPVPKAPLLARDNVTPLDEYKRPFITGRAVGPDAAFNRMKAMTATDIQLAKTKQARRVLQAGGVDTYMRVTTSENPCDLCLIASTQIYYTDDLMPIHAGTCMCDVEPIPHDWAQQQLDDLLPDDETLDNSEGDDEWQGHEEKRLAHNEAERNRIREKRRLPEDERNQILADHKAARAKRARDRLTINDHSELGPVLSWKGQHFTDAREANARTGTAA
jgi:hypothetical protein